MPIVFAVWWQYTLVALGGWLLGSVVAALLWMYARQGRGG
jgi:hypothetical protein